MSRPSLGVALMLVLAGLVLLASNVAGNLSGLPLIGIPVSAASGVSVLGGSGPSGAPLTVSQGPAATQELLSSLIIIGLLLGFMVWRFRKTVPKEQGGIDLYFILMGLCVFVTLVVGGRAIVSLLVSMGGVNSGSVDYLQASAVFYGTAALAISVIVASLLSAMRRRVMNGPVANDPGDAVLHEVRDVIRGNVYSLRESSDHRKAVLDCYRALCGVLQEGGAEDSPVLTAREFEAMAAAKLHIRTGYLARLTELFEKARYSSNVVDEADAQSAEASLVELERELQTRSSDHAATGGLRG